MDIVTYKTIANNGDYNGDVDTQNPLLFQLLYISHRSTQLQQIILDLLFLSPPIPLVCMSQQKYLYFHKIPHYQTFS